MRISIVILALGLFISCQNQDEVKDTFDREALLINYRENLILPAFQNFKSKLEVLKTSSTSFNSEPSSENLMALKEAFEACRLSWKSCEIDLFGPVETLALENSFDLWPTNQAGIETAISNFDGSDAYLTAIGSDKRGLAAIEYLVYHESAELVVVEFSDEKRRSYLSLLVADLTKNIDKILSKWSGAYGDAFVADLGSSTGAGITEVANEMIYHLETIKNYKVGLPLGLLTGGDPLPEKVESPFANQSLELLSTNVTAIKATFMGGAGIGYDDYLDQLGVRNDEGELLSEEILAKIESVEADILAINASLKEAVISEKSKVEQVFVDLQGLTVLLKNDMMSRLGLIVTFSDSDGD